MKNNEFEMNCEDLFNEISENASLQSELNGGSWVSTIVCTVLQGTLGCGVSYVLGNTGYGCTATKECQGTCN